MNLADRYAHAATVLRLWVANSQGEMDNEAYRRRHQHEPDYLAQREEQIEEMRWLAEKVELAAKAKRGE